LSHGYGNQRLFDGIDAHAETGCIHTISGANGSGKSTLLQILSGALEPEKGNLQYAMNDTAAAPDFFRGQIAYVAPCQELPPEFSLNELIRMQQQLSGSAALDSCLHMADYFGISAALNKPLGQYSTGMKQKAKFVLAFGTARPVWLLDEPGSNLDAASCQLLHQLLLQSCSSKLIMLASNDAAELALGRELVSLTEGVN